MMRDASQHHVATYTLDEGGDDDDQGGDHDASSSITHQIMVVMVSVIHLEVHLLSRLMTRC